MSSFYSSILLLWWVSEPMTHLCIYRDFAIAFVGNYSSFLCATVRSCVLPLVWYAYKSASVGNYSSIVCNNVNLLWTQISICHIFANSVCSQSPELSFVGRLLVLWVRYVNIFVSLLVICYSLESTLVGHYLLLLISTWMPYYIYCKSTNWHLNAIWFIS